jgi:hypothetical protein
MAIIAIYLVMIVGLVALLMIEFNALYSVFRVRV